ncbi:MAG: bifunctional proline dehydrogenase/L-glutamate gamma-semialdehyde dehydrogenase PutA [Rickettsiales bacterium]
MNATPHDFSDVDGILRDISAAALKSEAEAVAALLPFLSPFEEKREEIAHAARVLLEKMRAAPSVGVEAFLAEYRLSDAEGAAIMCMAEALLRVPDANTADALIESAFAGAEWGKKPRHSDSFLINAVGKGMALAGKTLALGKSDALIIASMARAYGADVVRGAVKKAMRFGAGKFVAGQNLDDAFRRAEKSDIKHYRFSYDMLGECARNAEQAQRYYGAYLSAIRMAGEETHLRGYARPSVSVKISALHPRYELFQWERTEKELYPRLKALLLEARERDVCVSFDAEESARLDTELRLFCALCRDPDLKGYNGLGFVLQAYQKRALSIIPLLEKLAKESERRMPIRLVKGAYWDTEIKAAQVAGLSDFPVFTYKYHTDASYLACARRLLDAGKTFFPQFATHNAHTVAAIRAYSPDGEYEFQRLYGMGDALYGDLSREAPCRIYAPVGEHEELLPYLIRRLLENGASANFVHLAANKKMPPERILQDPMAKTHAGKGKRNADVALPKEIFGAERANPLAPDWGNAVQVNAAKSELGAFLHKRYAAGEGMRGNETEIRSPFNRHDVVGTYKPSSLEDVKRAGDTATAYFSVWRATSPAHRATILRRASDLLDERRAEITALLMREAGKTVKDAVSELREAIDFCRYYASEACRLMTNPVMLPGPTGESNALSLHPRGTFVCVSPWNFPLAIFLGQIAAALASGNTAVAKPAPQTPLIAALATKILYEAGIPEEALQLVFGGAEIGEEALTLPRLAGVCFTGSTRAAKEIQKRLAEREGPVVPLIAETGGLNVMIADGTALPEQVADDALASAFGSAGQRCSALRLLFLPEEGADSMLKIMEGAVLELSVGDPTHFSTDVGPVIDEEARAKLLAWEKTLDQSGAELRAKANLPPSCDNGCFVAPQLWKLPDSSMVREEHFGPILHVATYRAFDDAVAFANNTGYGLTFGLHSRIRKRYASIAETVSAGNIYVNRGMTGAVVGSQPFGGENLSGTGFKAGGPHYLLRFLQERVVTINTAAAGGNADLLAKE